MSNDRTPQKCCPTDFVIHTLSTRWTLPLVKALAKGPLRPSELTKMLQGISAKSLTQRLRELEGVGLLTRTSYQEIPPRVVYELTERGKDLLFVLDALEEIGESWQRSLPEYATWGANDQCAHCYTHLSLSSKAPSADGTPEIPANEGRNYDDEIEAELLRHRESVSGDKLDHELMPTQAYFS